MPSIPDRIRRIDEETGQEVIVSTLSIISENVEETVVVVHHLNGREEYFSRPGMWIPVIDQNILIIDVLDYNIRYFSVANILGWEIEYVAKSDKPLRYRDDVQFLMENGLLDEADPDN